jgi:threonine synthase
MGSLATGLRCISCGKEYVFKRDRYLCDYCGRREIGDLLTFLGVLEVIYNYERVQEVLTKELLKSRTPGLWRYSELLPLASDIISLGEGGTVLSRGDRLGHELGLKHLYLKDETSNPSGGFKDRETAVAITKAREYGFQAVSCASTGTAAASLAAYAAKAGLYSFVFVPTNALKSKLVQALMHGARVFAAGDYYEAALKLQTEASDRYGWYNCSPAINPFRTEGDKTIAYEICEQLGWRSPDRVIIPTGGGGDLSAEWKGFNEFLKLGFINSLPRMTAVQIAAGAPLAKAFQKELDEVIPVDISNTVAGSLRSAYTDYASVALAALRESKGSVQIVDDRDVVEATKLIAQTEGIFAEPSGAASIAGLIKMIDEKEIDKEEVVVCVITGTGLREVEEVEKAVPGWTEVDTNVEHLDKVL